MKIALVHDYIKEYGGAERVLEALHEIYPDAPIYTSLFLPQFLGPHRKRFEEMDIRPSFLQQLPIKDKLISPIRLIAPMVFKSFDLSKFDLIIVSATGAYSPNLIKKSGAIQVCYCHTPPRYLYGFATAREWKKNPLFKILGEGANHFLRLSDFKSAKNVDYFIANSKNVQRRINKFYRKEAVVIYPPVDISNTKYKILNTKYYLAGGRLARPKHIDLIVKTFTKNKLPLKIFGKAFAGYGEELKAIAGKNINFLGEITDLEKEVLMSKAKAFVFASEDEDFGITPVEATAAATPVIAYSSGGVLESVIEGKTGIFFNELTTESLDEAIKKLEKVKFNKEEMFNHAQKFSKERFKKEIKKYIQSLT